MLIFLGMLIFLTILFTSPTVVFVILLLSARVQSFRSQLGTGPGTFALHIAPRVGRRSFVRASE